MSASPSPSPFLRIARVASLGVLAWWIGCTGQTYVGGRCGETEDCHTPANNIPGSICTDSVCECLSGDDKCCPGGNNANCKEVGDYRCRPYDECHPAEPCTTVADCAQPAEPRCAKAICEGGACVIEITPLTKLDSQIRGDCQHLWCDGAGNVVAIPDGEDTYNDGRSCTIDTCENGAPKSTPYKDGSPCPEGGSGWCYAGECVECMDWINGANDCGAGHSCDAVFCVPSSCVVNNQCGGVCALCPTGYPCAKNADCKDGICDPSGMCALPTCSDAVQNDGETGIDCGAPSCDAKCADGGGCKAHSDCASGVCWAGKCQAPTCNDGWKNGSEVKTDCGGSCPACP